MISRARVLHTVAGLNERFGGPSRTVPATCDGIRDKVEWVGLASQRFIGLRDRVILPSSDVPVFLSTAVFAARVAIGARVTSDMRRIISQNDVSIVHDHGAWQLFNASVAKAAALEQVPRIVAPRGMMMSWPMSRHRLRRDLLMRLFQRNAMDSAAGFVVTSHQEGIELRELGARQPVAIIPNGIDLPEQLPLRELNHERLVGFLSRIHPKKGLIRLVQAWGFVRPSGWKLVIAGPDEEGHGAEVLRQIESLGLAGVVNIKPAIPDREKYRFLRNCEVTVLPSESENFGMVVGESLAAGVPVITSRGTPWQHLESNGCGWWAEPTVHGLAEALSIATSLDPEALQEMGQRGRELIKSSYSWQSVGARTVHFYEWLGGKGDMPNFVMAP